jgi:phosphatidate phosphatase APP1
MDKTRYSLFENPQQYKPPLIEPILKSYPERKFVMVGDSGERDPEIYGDLARAYRKQVEHIFIRAVTSDSIRSARYAQAFRDLPASMWTLFHDPAKIAGFKPEGH